MKKSLLDEWNDPRNRKMRELYAEQDRKLQAQDGNSDAADIDALRAENAKLREALQGPHGDRLNFVASLLMEARNLPIPNGVDWDAWAITLDEADLFVKEARAALA